MRHVLVCVGLAAMLSVGLLVSRPTAVSGNDGKKAGTRWQYKVLNAYELQKLNGLTTPQEGLDKLGEEGWELVAVEPGVPRPGSVAANDSDHTQPVVFARAPNFYFKRQKQ